MEQQRDDAMNWKRNFNIAWWLCLMHQRGLILFMRKGFGVRALGVPCALAFVLMFLWATFSRDPFMWLWMGMWLLCQVKRRAESLKLARSGAMIHSQYDGWPFDAVRFAGSEKAAKLVVEPILVGILGGLLYWIYGEQGWSPYGLPYFVLAGCFSLPLVEAVKQTIWERRTQAMVDARLEQEEVMRDFRDKYGEF
jgi:hypothetical protein